jgi:transglutaminase-like putative cysteine protease
MMKRIVLSLLLLMVVLNLSSQSYLFDSIPENLKRGADAVIRSEQALFTIIKPGNAVLKTKKVITLLNENTLNYRYLTVRYDKFSKVNYVRGTIYDEKGEIIKVLGTLDVQDWSAVTGGTFYSDDRMKVLYFPLHKFPYTIEYEYEVEYSSIVNYPFWIFQDSPDESVEKSGIQIVVPSAMKLRYFGEYLKNPVDSVIEKDVRIYTWLEENIAARSRRQYSLEEVPQPPLIYSAPLDFEYGGFKGSMRSWKSLGEWVYSLNKGRDELSPAEKQKVAELVTGAKDEREKVKLIYEYVQATTRYVSIDIGIGGFQPAQATDVAKNGFGDCKGLANYAKALLKAAGINSYYTLVLAGETRQLNHDFVANHFNHAILCVPMIKDTIWLDCTSQTLPFNFLGNFTDDRPALLITPEGGKLVRTPAFVKTENVFKRTGTVSMNNFGKSSAKLNDYYSGVNYQKASARFGQASDEEMKRYLNSYLRFSDINSAGVKFTETKAEKPSAVFAYDVNINDFAVITGKVMTFNPVIEKAEYVQDFPASIEIPEYNISSDSITYNLPIGYKVEFKPADVRLENEFGKFSYETEVKNNKLIYKRYLEMNKGVFPVEKFEDFRNFINSVARADGELIILKN